MHRRKRMAPADTTASSRPARWGLAAKLFAILLLLGAVAVLVTGVLGYVRARDALAGVDLQPAHGRPQKQGAPGRDLLPHHPQRADASSPPRK